MANDFDKFPMQKGGKSRLTLAFLGFPSRVQVGREWAWSMLQRIPGKRFTYCKITISTNSASRQRQRADSRHRYGVKRGWL